MDIHAFTEKAAGGIAKSPQGYFAFIPHRLPPRLEYSAQLVGALSEADRSLAILEGVGRRLPNPHLLVNPYMRREAVLSSRIEGTQASMSDLFLFEAEPQGEAKRADTREVYNYVRALSYGLKRLSSLPLSLRLVRELHLKLMRGVRGHETRGEFRKRQNWVGPAGCSLADAAFVPPPPPEMTKAMSEWEKFLHTKDGSLPPLVQCGMLHYQFEAIHPFADGNGRVGRLLIILFLCERGLLTQPLLYLSAYLERNRAEYYDRLQGVDRRGEWEEWLRFFLQGVALQSRDAVATAERLLGLHKEYRESLQRRRVTAPTLALVDEIFINPYITIPRARDRLRVSYPTAQAAVNRLVDAGILKEATGKRRNRLYCAVQVLQLAQGSEG